MAAVYWLIFFVILVVIEIGTMALTTIWFAGGALAAFLLALFGAGIELQLTVFVIVSFVLLFFTRPWAARFFNSHTKKTNVESLAGTQARITETVDNDLGSGTALVGGQEWTARSFHEHDRIPAGTMVYIREVKGVKLIVSREKEEL